MTQARNIFSNHKFVYRDLMPYKDTTEPGHIARKLAMPVATPSEQIRAAFRRSRMGMFSCARIHDASFYLSNHLIHQDYHSEVEMVTGKWIGGASRQTQPASKSVACLALGDDRLIEANRAAVGIAQKELEAHALAKTETRKGVRLRVSRGE